MANKINNINNTGNLSGRDNNKPKSPLHNLSIPPHLPTGASLASTHLVTLGAPLINTDLERAKKDAAQDPIETTKNIENYNLDEDGRFEIAQILATRHGSDGSRISQCIANFNLNEDRRFEIALILAARHQKAISQYIQNFNLNKERRFEIAKMVAARDGSAISKYIHKFELDAQMRFKIAKIAVAHDVGASDYIRNYEMDQKMYFEIAKIAASQDGSLLSLFIKKYGITDQKMLFEIAEIAAIQNGRGTSEYINNYEFNTIDQELQILRICFHQMAATALKKGELSAKVLDAFIDIMFRKHTNLLQQKKDILWFVELLGSFIPLGDDKTLPLLTCICKMTDSSLRNKATRTLSYGYRDPKTIENMKKLMQEKAEDLYLAILFSTVAGFDKETTEKLLTELTTKYYKHPQLIGLINELMSVLQNSTGLSTDTKQQFIQLIFFNTPVKDKTESKTDYNNRLHLYREDQKNWIAALHSLLYCGQDEILSSINDTTTLVSQWQKFMENTFYIKPDAMAQFFPIFGDSERHPNGLITYATRLHSLPREEKDRLMPLLGKFAAAVLDGTFPEMRYSFANNKHLETVFSGKAELLKKWKTSLPIKMENTLQEIAKKTTPQEHVRKLMRDALENHHLGPDQDEKYPALKEIVKGNFIDHQLTGVELICAAVLNPKTTKPELQSAVKKLQKLFLDPSSQFHHDLKGMRATLNSSNSSESWTIEDTDAWEDLLMMGTEVDNSCQSIHREPSTNKCLLSYILDGKTRLMIARDTKGKIVGRVVLRVLWDKAKKKPVLFVEKLYTRTGINPDKVGRDILAGCKQKAASMGMPLVSSELKGTKYRGTLQALGGLAPFEYVDALAGIQNDGIYSIPECYLL